jgi:hypothetical protein
MKSFITFGCWNNLFDETVFDKPKQGSNRDVVLRKVGNYVRDNADVTDLMISGDNYYQNKLETNGQKRNNVIIEDIYSGFDLLRKEVPEKPIHMVYGNHDLLPANESFTIGPKAVPLESALLGKCIIRDEENNAARHNHINLGFMHFSRYGEHTLILMIDTSIYTSDFGKTQLCYGDSSDNTQLKQAQYQAIMEFIESHLSKKIKNIIVIGHHPIIYQKFKKGKPDKPGKNMVNYEPELAELFVEIHNRLDNQTIYYLCADFHVFEHGLITITTTDAIPIHINQFIVGTGGAKLDELSNPDPVIVSDQTINYTPVAQLSEHGFLVCTDPGDGDFTFKFVGLSGVEGRGVKRRNHNKRTHNKRSKRNKRTHNKRSHSNHNN